MAYQIKSDNKILYLRDSLMGYGKKDMIEIAWKCR